MVEETRWTGLFLHSWPLKAVGKRQSGWVGKDKLLDERSNTFKQTWLKASCLSLCTYRPMSVFPVMTTKQNLPQSRPLLLFNVVCVWLDASHCDIILATKHFVTICDMIHRVCFSVSKAIREQICWTNWFEECQQRLSLSIALPTPTVREETHFQPQSVATFCRSLIGFLSISASVCQNICIICCKTVHFIFKACCLRVGWADNGDRFYVVPIPNQVHKNTHNFLHSLATPDWVDGSQEWKMYLSAGSYMCKDKQCGKLCISQVMAIDTQIVSMPVLLCTVYKPLV